MTARPSGDAVDREADVTIADAMDIIPDRTCVVSDRPRWTDPRVGLGGERAMGPKPRIESR
jgi:hypothetical protein